MYQLDSTDVKILQILQTDGKIPLTRLSEQLGVPHATLRDRIRKLENAGVIEGYETVVNPAQVGFHISCFVEIVLDHQVETSRSAEALMDVPEVTELKHPLQGTETLVSIARARALLGFEPEYERTT